jgi:hypothetical protein
VKGGEQKVKNNSVFYIKHSPGMKVNDKLGLLGTDMNENISVEGEY